MKLMEGHSYVDREGSETGPLIRIQETETYPFYSKLLQRTYTDEGIFNNSCNKNDSFDLIEKVSLLAFNGILPPNFRIINVDNDVITSLYPFVSYVSDREYLRRQSSPFYIAISHPSVAEFDFSGWDHMDSTYHTQHPMFEIDVFAFLKLFVKKEEDKVEKKVFDINGFLRDLELNLSISTETLQIIKNAAIKAGAEWIEPIKLGKVYEYDNSIVVVSAGLSLNDDDRVFYLYDLFGASSYDGVHESLDHWDASKFELVANDVREAIEKGLLVYTE